MAEYIEREAAYKTLTDYYHHSTDTQHGALREALGRIPAADVVPVRHGRWIVTAEFTDCVYAQCDQCEITQVFYYNKPLTNYCPNCGARMDGDGDV